MNDRLRQILSDVNELEPWPQVSLRVMELSTLPDVVPSEVIEVIRTDAALTARVLKLSNSAYFGFRRELSSLVEAGNALGVRRLVGLVLTSCANRYFGAARGVDPAAGRRLWERSITAALAARLLAGVQGGVDAERAYTAALLQNMGQLVIERHAAAASAEIAAARASGLDLLAAEREVLGLDHAQLGGRLARRWNLPEVLCDTIEHHHAPERASLDPLLASVAHLAEELTWVLALDDGLDGLEYALSDEALALSGLDRPGFLAVEEALVAELDKARGLLAAA